MRVALFGGSFDPPHCGHIKIARAAKAALRLDKILMAPVGKQPLKSALQSTGFQDRLQMVALAVANEEGIEASDADAPRSDGRPNYTLDTLKRLHKNFGSETALFFLMGADSLQSFKTWHRAAELLFTAEFIIAARPGFSLMDLAQALPSGIQPSSSPESSLGVTSFLLTNSDGIQTHLHLLPELREDISATGVRAALKTGKDEQAIVPAAVLQYIRKNSLYR